MADAVVVISDDETVAADPVGEAANPDVVVLPVAEPANDAERDWQRRREKRERAIKVVAFFVNLACSASMPSIPLDQYSSQLVEVAYTHALRSLTA